MGVPRFYRDWVVTHSIQMPGMLAPGIPGTEGNPGNVSSLSIDMNGIIHSCLMRVYAYGDGEKGLTPDQVAERRGRPAHELREEFFGILFNELIVLVTAVRPVDTLVIAVDGVAPVAKLVQQKQRRYRSTTDRIQIIRDNNLSKAKAKQLFDSNSVTPGTEFMITLDRKLSEWVNRNLPTFDSETQTWNTINDIMPNTIIYSGHLTAGEGEQKIMEFYRNGTIQNSDNPNGFHLLYGLDADLIMLSLLSPLNRIVLSRQDLTTKPIDIDNFRAGLRSLMESDTAVEDFVLMMGLVGNDFLPNGPALEEMGESIDTMIIAYKAAGRAPLIDTKTGEIIWPNFAHFLEFLAGEEELLLAKRATIPYIYEATLIQNSMDREGAFHPDVFWRLWYENEFKPRRPSELIDELLRDVVLEVEPLENKIEAMTLEYLTSLAWFYRYFSQGGDAINLIWFYGYYHAPLLRDVRTVSLTIRTDDEEVGPEENVNYLGSYAANENMLVYGALHQLVAVLPPESADLLPEKLRFLINHSDSPIIDLYPSAEPGYYIIEREGKGDRSKRITEKDVKHHGIAILPFPDMYRISDAMEAIEFTEADHLEKWDPRLPLSPQSLDVEAAYIKTRTHKRLMEAETNRYLRRLNERQQEQRSRGRGRGRGSQRGRGRGSKTMPPQSGGVVAGRVWIPPHGASMGAEPLAPPPTIAQPATSLTQREISKPWVISGRGSAPIKQERRSEKLPELM